jgi:hypothetical protein
MRLGINQLEEMYAKNTSEPQVLRQLANELQYRQVPKAIALMSDVQSALRKFSHVSSQSPTISPPMSIKDTDPQPELWRQPMSLDKFSTEKIADLESLLLLLVPSSDAIGNVSLRNLLAERGWDDELYWAIRNRLIERGILETGRGKGGSVRRASGAASVTASSVPAADAKPMPILPAPDPTPQPISVTQTISAASPLKQAVMPLEDAYRVLRVASTSTWNVIELARRQLVQQASPAKTATLEVEKRSQLQEQARRANLACLSIWRIRLGGKL